MTTQKTKQDIISAHKKHDSDTGSTEVQIALINNRVDTINDHLKNNKKDVPARRALLQLVALRRRFLKYLDRRQK